VVTRPWVLDAIQPDEYGVAGHPICGVQARHYGRHGYFAEKKQALQKWAKQLKKLEAIQTSISGSTSMSVPIGTTRRCQGRSDVA
jgi:hypothetical protein